MSTPEPVPLRRNPKFVFAALIAVLATGALGMGWILDVQWVDVIKALVNGVLQ